MTEEEINDGLPWATMDRIRIDLRKRADQVASIARRLRRIVAELEKLEADVAIAETSASGGKRRRRRRGSASADKGPSVIEVAVDILKTRGVPMACTDLARAVLARGVNSGNNERSLRMSASKGKKLASLPGDVITLP